MKEQLIYLLILVCFLSCSSYERSFNHFKANKKVGGWIEVVDSDTISFEKVNYEDGVKQGEAEMYLKNGDVVIGDYQNGKKHGAWKYYNKESELYQIEYYTEGYVSRIEFIEDGKVVKEAITDPPF